MPAITAAANPVAAVTSPPAGAGKSASGSDSSEQRPFAVVLAEQAGKPPKAEGKGSRQEAPSASGKDNAGKAEAGDPALATTPADAPTAPPLFVPADLLLTEGAGDEETLDTQIQAAAELMQSVLPLAGTNLPAPAAAAAPVTPLIAQAGVPAPLTAAMAASAIPVETDALGDSPAGSIADMRLALARSKPDEATPSAGTGIAPAKLAVAPEPLALQPETGTIQAVEFAIPKSDAALAAAGASFAGAVPMHAAAATQAGHGGEYRIVTPVGSQHWEAAIGNSLVVMAGAGQERAELVLTPPQLGRIEVSIAIKGDEASAVFVSASPAVREALESALPRLREVLADAGITLGQTHVGSESPGQTAGDSQNGDNPVSGDIAGAADGNTMQRELTGRDGAVQRRLSLALVDTYA
jgi:flagellar hook-length control protein FliK